MAGKSKNVHVVPHKDGWAVKTPGSDRAHRVTDTQKKAIDIGEDLARKHGGDLLTHRKDGRIRSKDSFGPDPNPPKDREH